MRWTRTSASAVDDDAVRVIVLRGAGKHFNAGHDIGTPGQDLDKPFERVQLWWDHSNKPGGEASYAREQEIYIGMCRRWHDIPKPTIAMVQGGCIAGGLMLAWVCDLIVAADDAFFQDPVVRMGVPGVEYFAHAQELNPRIAKEFLFLGERMPAERAYMMGMVNRVVPRERLEAETYAIAARIATAAPHGPGAGQAGAEPGGGPAGPARQHRHGLRLPPLRACARPGGQRQRHRRAGCAFDGRGQQGRTALSVGPVRAGAAAPPAVRPYSDSDIQASNLGGCARTQVAQTAGLAAMRHALWPALESTWRLPPFEEFTMFEKLRPDPTFHPSPRLAMEAERERIAYTALLSPDASRPDALAVVDVDPGSKTYGSVLHRLDMPHRGDEFHHFGWNACSSALSPMSGHAFLKRRYLVMPGIRSSRI